MICVWKILNVLLILTTLMLPSSRNMQNRLKYKQKLLIFSVSKRVLKLKYLKLQKVLMMNNLNKLSLLLNISLKGLLRILKNRIAVLQLIRLLLLLLMLPLLLLVHKLCIPLRLISLKLLKFLMLTKSLVLLLLLRKMLP